MIGAVRIFRARSVFDGQIERLDSEVLVDDPGFSGGATAECAPDASTGRPWIRNKSSKEPLAQPTPDPQTFSEPLPQPLPRNRVFDAGGRLTPHRQVGEDPHDPLGRR